MRKDWSANHYDGRCCWCLVLLLCDDEERDEREPLTGVALRRVYQSRSRYPHIHIIPGRALLRRAAAGMTQRAYV